MSVSTHVSPTVDRDGRAGSRPFRNHERSREATPRRILVIEDKADIADTMRIALTLSGHTVDVASDGEEGIRKAILMRPDVVLSDIGLPGAPNGLEVAERLRASGLFASTYMMAITGASQVDDVKRALSAGFDLHMSKPVDIRAVLRVIAEHFSQSDW